MAAVSLFWNTNMAAVTSCEYAHLILRESTQIPFRVTTENVFQFTLRRRTVVSATKKFKCKFLKGMNCYARVDDSIHQLVYSTDTQPKVNGNVFSFDKRG